MLSKTDKGWIETEMRQELIANNVKIKTEMARTVEGLRNEIGAKHDEVITALDQIMGEVAKGREHDLVVAHQIEKLNKRVFAD